MNKFYFTFGCDKNFPFKNSYIIIEAEDIEQAARIFKALFPNPNGNDIINCSDYYSEEMWQRATANHDLKFKGTFRVKFTPYRELRCCICGEEITTQTAHNAAPVERGWCCDKCNITKVVPARIAMERGESDGNT